MDGDRSPRMHPGPIEQNGVARRPPDRRPLADVALRSIRDGPLLRVEEESALAKASTVGATTAVFPRVDPLAMMIAPALVSANCFL